MSRQSILLLCDDRPSHADTVLDHIHALQRLSRHEVHTFNPFGVRRSRALELDEFDAVVIHYSLVCVSDQYLATPIRERIKRFTGLKLQFIQDEYRWVNSVCSMINELGIGILFSSLPPDEMYRIYGPRLPGVHLEHTLTGYVPERLVGREVPDVADRQIHIGYRGRELPFWLGRTAYEKVAIAAGVKQRATAFGLSTDIEWRETDRLYGPEWTKFLSACRATLGTGSGSSIIDYDGSIEREVRAYLAAQPSADFETVQAAVLGPHEGNVRFEVISPRVFEGAALRTALILFPATFSGILEAERHFIPLERDFSNFEDVARRLKDDEYIRELTQRAYDDLIASGRYSTKGFVAAFDEVVDEHAREPRPRRPKVAYRLAKIEAGIGRDRGPATVWLLARLRAGGAAPLVRAVESTPILGRLVRDPSVFSQKGAWALRMLVADGVFRRVFAAWLRRRSMRSRIPSDVLLEEALELTVAGKLISRHEVAYTLAVHHEGPAEPLVLESTAEPQLDATQRLERALAEGFTRVEWDHRAYEGRLGAVAGPDRQTRDLHIGSGGIARMELLAVLATERPDLFRALVTPLLSITPAATGAGQAKLDALSR